ncbi:MAG TPA: M12 family metallo-peptidase [Thermoanaerobaculia bacterium]
MESRIEGRAFRGLSRPLAPGARVSLARIPVGDTVATLELERFEVWAPGAEIVIEHGNGRREKVAPPPVQYFRGTVGDDPESMVFVAVRTDGAVEGMVIANDRRYRMNSRNDEAKDVFVEEVGMTDDTDESGFMCELDKAPIEAPRGVPTVRSDATGGVTANGTLSATGTWTLNLAIETDFELFTDLGSSAANVNTYIGNLVGAASVIYQRDLRTDLVIAFSRVQTAAADPFTVDPGQSGTWNGAGTTFATSHALAELGDIWANAGTRPYSGPRSSVVLVSGKNQTAGVAWTARACQGDFACAGGNCGDPLFNGHTGGAYAYIGLGNQTTTVVPNPNNTTNGVQYGLPSSNYWALLGFAHELGHNVDGPHTHCVGLTEAQKTQYGVTRNFIDECVNGCFAGTTSVPPEKGTIMSYCHMLGSSQSRFLFGRSLETSEIMVNRIRSYINNRTPASPAISAPSSLDVNTSSSATISSPVGGITYNWSIVNGTINGSSTGTSVNFTATTNPVTLRVRGTNASGCAASETVNVTVNTCTAPVISSITQSVVLTLGSSVNLSATASGAGPFTYQWYVGAPGNTTTPAAVGNPISASPSSSTTYWVRATGACGFVDSAGVNIGVVAPPENPSSLYIVNPCRIIDTRGPVGPFGGPALANAATRNVQITGNCGIPAGAKSVVANITAVGPTTSGFLALYAAGLTWPGNSTLNYRAAKTRANSALLLLSNDGRVTVLNVGATQNFIIDVTGYFQ